MTNNDIIKEAQAKILARGNNPDYLVEQHIKDLSLIADLTYLRIKYGEKERKHEH